MRPPSGKHATETPPTPGQSAEEFLNTAEQLRNATRAAGLRISPHLPDGELFVHLGNADLQTVLDLADLIEKNSIPGVNDHHAAPHTPAHSAPSEPGTGDIQAAAGRLRSAAQRAGLELHPGEPTTTPKGDRLPLGPVDQHTAQTLTGFITNSISSLFETMAEVVAALDEHGISLPKPFLHDGRLCLGTLPLPAADALLKLIDPEHNPEHDAETDEDDWEEGHLLARRLAKVLRAPTDGGFVHTEYHPHCRRCGAEEAITLDNLRPATTRYLTARLRKAGA